MIKNTFLVPGDQLIIKANMIIPCDCVLIKGEVMIDEASLTGESVPVPKNSLSENGLQYEPSSGFTLFEGTKVV